MSKQLSDREIEQLLFSLRQKLDFKEREEVRELLRQARTGGLYHEELHKKLLRLRDERKLGAGDHHAIEEAVFGRCFAE